MNEFKEKLSNVNSELNSIKMNNLLTAENEVMHSYYEALHNLGETQNKLYNFKKHKEHLYTTKSKASSNILNTIKLQMTFLNLYELIYRFKLLLA